jgi:putative hydrolase of the HAD superfamily
MPNAGKGGNHNSAAGERLEVKPVRVCKVTLRKAQESGRAVVFDLGGVVIRWSHHSTFLRMADELGVPSESFVRATDRELPPLLQAQVTEPEYWSRVSKRVGRDIPRTTWANWARDFHAIAKPDVRVVRWVQDLSRRGIHVACLSNTILAHARIIRRNGWVRPFSPALLSSEIGAAKPDPRAYELARRRIGLPPQDLLFLDDVPANVNAARASGWKAHRFVGVEDAQSWVEGHLHDF